MVLYHVITTYHLLEAIVHKIRNDEKATILISSWLVKKYPWYEELSIYFDKIIVFEDCKKYSLENAENILSQYYKKIFKEHNIDLGQFDEIHILGAEHSFGVYMAVSKQLFTFWEEGSGAISKPEKMVDLFATIDGREKAEFFRKLGLVDGVASNINKRICNKNTQIKIDGLSDAEHFDLIEELGLLKENDRDNIIRMFYGEEKLSLEKDSVVWLTEHFSNLKIMTWEEQEYVYKLLTDYFFYDKKLCFKLHPDDFMCYGEIFHNSLVVNKKFPAELLPYIFSEIPNCVATVSSSSIYGLKNAFNKSLEFDFDFAHRKQFYYFHRYYFCLEYLNILNKKYSNVYLWGVNDTILKNLCVFKEYNIPEKYEFLSEINNMINLKNSIVIVDEFSAENKDIENLCKILKEVDSSNVIVFINSQEDYCFYHPQHKYIWQHISMVELKQKSLLNNKRKSECIFFYSNGNKEVIFLNENKEVNLPNLQLNIEANVISENDRKVKILEGMLDAAEKRLIKYIEKEKMEDKLK